mmetsp:Transcript_40855/g.102867  ORF Transcript_40855/g.102867 Transcript_40855/m.102867 type:complete len:1038 (-) Transcript_40855:173-3286(-)
MSAFPGVRSHTENGGPASSPRPQGKVTPASLHDTAKPSSSASNSKKGKGKVDKATYEMMGGGVGAAQVSKWGVADMVMLPQVTEEALLDNLDKRLRNRDIYSYIGPVLISTNPYTPIDIYGKAVIQRYQGRYPYENPPHVYAVAESAYRSMLFEREDQSIIISGESGSGKTENSKKIMEYISAVCRSGVERVDYVKNIFLGSNPLLEAFGNAKTVRNDNSSRFGKYMVMQFNRRGEPIGGHVEQYLLEKSRIIHQLPGERNFHIFYQLLAGASKQDISDYKLMPPESFRYLKDSEFEIAGWDDAKEASETRKAMDLVQINKADQHAIFSVVAAVLHVGNVEFKADPKGNALLVNPDQVDLIANILQVPSELLKKALTHRTVTTTAQRGSRYEVPLSVASAEFTREALAKGLYGRLFNYLVQHINKSIKMDESGGFIIGVLDIYGFEIFGKNSFEQLCINYVNEKLQQIFIELTLKAEQEEYRKEGIAWEDVDYFNNQQCVLLIEKKPIGIFALLDEETLLGKGTDATFLRKMYQNLRTNVHLEQPEARPGGRGGKSLAGAPPASPSSSSHQTNPTCFVVKHYAGDVQYESEGFIEKNKDTLFRDLMLAMAQSSLEFVQNLFPEVTAESESKKRPPTLATQFRAQVGALMKSLYSCNPHYIRCIKPNSDKRALNFDLELTKHQVRYLGLLENIRVRRAGYAYRQEFDKFLARYKMITKSTWPVWKGEVKDGCREILKYLNIVESEGFQFGKTKVFVRLPEVIYELEEQRMRRLEDIATVIQKEWRAHQARKYLMELREAAMAIYSGNKRRRRQSVNPNFRGDYLRLKSDKFVEQQLARLGESKILFADSTQKINRRMKAQERVFVISEKAVYNLAVGKKRRIKRRIPLTSIIGIRLSTFCDGYLVLKVKNEVDWVGELVRKTEAVTVLRDQMAKIVDEVPPLECDTTLNVTSKKGKVDKNQLRFTENPAVAYNATQRKGGVLNITVGQRDAATDDDFRSVVEFKRMKDQRSGGSKPAAAGTSKGGGGQFAHLRANFEK